ncbi:RecQ family ATP-dependent DNA helicase [Microbacter margulisiae]|uniref:RecQ family ATP-dependent DNA helicase n=1 Tax=Microbacter margulisiae TaxID=1350067 RepID=UPI003CCE2232
MEPYLAILKQYWGYDEFRPLQSEIIQSIASGHDTLGLMPTGGGKSLTFQVPALAQEGLCLVVTPLIALMRDQVDNLQSRGIKAAMICTGMSRTEILTTLDNCTFGNYKFLYVSPERLSTDIFINRLSHLDINLITVDEAHCISQWGYDFRPSYLKIADIRSYLPAVPLLALTATATKAVIDDIQQKLLFKESNIFSVSFERPNLAYVVRRVDDKLPHIIHILSRVSGSAIIYVRARTKTKEVADFLNKNSVSADYFHAGLPRETKDAKQSAWKGNKVRVMVATNAFGMGIDKSDVSVVIHLDLPDSIEAYFQEAGRAGRDGKKAYAILIYSKTDGAVLKRRISDAFPPKERIIHTYNCLCNFYQIAIGSGFGFVVPFDLTKFCVTYHLPLNSTYHAFKILEQAGYIELTDELDNPSRLMITVTKEDLYLLRHKNDLWDTILQVTLRSYTGLFSDYAHISEEIIAQRAGTTREEVYIAFSQLTKENIVNYIPARKSPFVSFTQSREDERYITISKEVYEDRLLQFEGRIKAMLSYAEEENICRSQQLLSYFGQLYQKVCNQCDVCLKKKKSTFSEDDFEIYKETLGRILKNAPSTVQEILTKTKLQEEKIQQVLRYLQDDGTITVNDALQLCWRK